MSPLHSVLERFSLVDRVAVVTGSGGRLGPVWIEALAQANAVVVGLNPKGVPRSEAESALEARYAGRVHLRSGDVTNRESLEEVLAWCEAGPGIPDVLVNNAGIDQPPSSTLARHAIPDIRIDSWRPIIEVNLLGAFQAIQVFGGAMLRRLRGSIVNIGSLYASVSPDASFYDHLSGEKPFLKPPAYGASKAALVNVTKYLATHWAPQGVRVNALSPGGVLGEQDPEFRRKFCERVPMGRMAEAADLTGPLLFLVSDASSYVTGVELRVDGGFTTW